MQICGSIAQKPVVIAIQRVQKLLLLNAVLQASTTFSSPLFSFRRLSMKDRNHHRGDVHTIANKEVNTVYFGPQSRMPK